MQRDGNLILKLLERLEQSGNQPLQGPDQLGEREDAISVEGYEYDTTTLHLRILKDAGYVDSVEPHEVAAYYSRPAADVRLRWSGHNLLAHLRAGRPLLEADALARGLPLPPRDDGEAVEDAPVA